MRAQEIRRSRCQSKISKILQMIIISFKYPNYLFCYNFKWTNRVSMKMTNRQSYNWPRHKKRWTISKSRWKSLEVVKDSRNLQVFLGLLFLTSINIFHFCLKNTKIKRRKIQSILTMNLSSFRRKVLSRKATLILIYRHFMRNRVNRISLCQSITSYRLRKIQVLGR